MGRTARVQVVAFCGLILPLTSFAQVEDVTPMAWSVGGYLGAQVFDSDRDLTGEDSYVEPTVAPLLGARAQAQLPWLLVDVDVDLGLLLGLFEDDSLFPALQGRFEFRYDLVQGELRPFVALGPTLLAAFTTDFGTDLDVGASGGGGVFWDWDDSISMRLDVRWLLGDGVAGAANDLEASAGVVFAL